MRNPLDESSVAQSLDGARLTGSLPSPDQTYTTSQTRRNGLRLELAQSKNGQERRDQPRTVHLPRMVKQPRFQGILLSDGVSPVVTS
jgi:hypothetical protein